MLKHCSLNLCHGRQAELRVGEGKSAEFLLAVAAARYSLLSLCSETQAEWLEVGDLYLATGGVPLMARAISLLSGNVYSLQEFLLQCRAFPANLVRPHSSNRWTSIHRFYTTGSDGSAWVALAFHQCLAEWKDTMVINIILYWGLVYIWIVDSWHDIWEVLFWMCCLQYLLKKLPSHYKFNTLRRCTP